MNKEKVRRSGQANDWDRYNYHISTFKLDQYLHNFLTLLCVIQNNKMKSTEFLQCEMIKNQRIGFFPESVNELVCFSVISLSPPKFA